MFSVTSFKTDFLWSRWLLLNYVHNRIYTYPHYIVLTTWQDIALGTWWILAVKCKVREAKHSALLTRSLLVLLVFFQLFLNCHFILFVSPWLMPEGEILIKSHWWGKNVRVMLFCISYLLDVFISSCMLCFFSLSDFLIPYIFQQAEDSYEGLKQALCGTDSRRN